MIIASRKNIGATYNPPGMKSIIIPIMVGIHHVPRLVWAWVCSFFLSGIRVLEWGFGNKAYPTIGACAILATIPLSRLASMSIGLSWAIITVTLPFLLTSSRKLVVYPK